MTAWLRRAAGPLAIAVVAAIFVWNLIFDLVMGQVERQYLWRKAGHALGEARDVTLDGTIAAGVREGAVIATAWTLVVVGAILLAAWLGYRAGRRPAVAASADGGGGGERREPPE
jgi:hypothetical protein